MGPSCAPAGSGHNRVCRKDHLQKNIGALGASQLCRKDSIVTDRLPNFFIIGAAKSGTTSLHEYLAQHPQIYMSFPKELNFFSFAGSTPAFFGPSCDFGNHVLHDRLRREKYDLSITTWPDYRKVFSRVRLEKAIGESSVSYLYFPQASEKIRQNMPGARLIAILRNPVDRAYSKYRQLRRDGAEPLIQFEEALAAEPARMRANWSPAWFYVDRGFYHRQLKRYYEVFDRRQIHIVLYEEFMRRPTEMLRDVLAFLQVEAEFRIDLGQRYNLSEDCSVPANITIYNFFARPNWFSTRARAVMPAELLVRLRPIVKSVITRKTSKDDIPPLTDQTRQSLRRVFREDILLLQDMIRKDLSDWL
jgi:Sulfotransferase family